MFYRGRVLRVKWPKQQSQSTEVGSSPKDRLQFHQVHLTMLQYYMYMQCTQNNESTHTEMDPVRQNPIQRTVCMFICVCIALCTIVAHNIAYNRPDNFPSYAPENHQCTDDVYLREEGQRKQTSNRLFNRCDNRLYRVNGVLLT